MAAHTLVIVNPASRGGRRTGRWPAVEAALHARLGRVDVAHTAGPRDAGRLARDAVERGVGRLVVAGGDGTASEVVAGVLAAGAPSELELGFLPFGTGRDLARGLGIPLRVDAAIETIAAGHTRVVDAGRVTLRDETGNERQTFFANVGSVGLAAAVVGHVAPWTRALGGQVAFAIAFARSLWSWRSSPLTLRVDGEVLVDGPLDVAAVALGRYFGGGMRLAPQASWDDGCFDVIAVRAMRPAQWLRRIPLVYSGRHLDLDTVEHARGRCVEVEWRGDARSAPRVELDGGPSGAAPARFDVMPGALRVLTPVPPR